MTTPLVKGWCPGAHRPMQSGDGLVVRVRPFRAHLDTAQALGLCDLAQRFGNGTLDLTSRANLQIRGVAAEDHATLLEALDALGVLDEDASVESLRNILVNVDWEDAGLTYRLYNALLQTLPRLPEMPLKIGFALDTGPTAQLAGGSADFRFERDDYGGLILRADGASLGRPVVEASAMSHLAELADWFVATGGAESGRMARHLKNANLPDIWQQMAPRPAGSGIDIGALPSGLVIGAAFGKIDAGQLARLITASRCRGIRLTLNRMLLLRGAYPSQAPGFVMSPGDPMLRAHACPGAPFCEQASVVTRPLAAELAYKWRKRDGLHVSGCEKGCACPKSVDITLVGRDGSFDLVRQGAPWDEPERRGLTAQDLLDLKI